MDVQRVNLMCIDMDRDLLTGDDIVADGVCAYDILDEVIHTRSLLNRDVVGNAFRDLYGPRCREVCVAPETISIRSQAGIYAALNKSELFFNAKYNYDAATSSLYGLRQRTRPIGLVVRDVFYHFTEMSSNLRLWSFGDDWGPL